MRFVSYAQNYEDVMLWRALQHVQGGFYIDVGANDPVKDSVTKAFYDRGWHGINVEPVAAHHADLERERPLDANLRCALGDRAGSIDLWECTIPGLGTTDRAVVEQHLREGREGQWQAVPVTTLAAVCAEHRATGEIHFLKIDVEGGEASVLRGADFRRFRPWIVVVEATRPNSTEENHDSWEYLLTGADYRFAYADGLNRFYLAREHEALAPAFAYPPNVFDAFIVAQQHNAQEWADVSARQARELQARQAVLLEAAAAAERRSRQAEAQAHAAGVRANRAEREAAYQTELAQAARRALARREAQLEQARNMLQLLYASRSWRVTKPLRWVTARLKGEPTIDPAPALQALRFSAAVALPPAQAPAAPDDSMPDATSDDTIPQALWSAPTRVRRIYDAMREAADVAARAGP